MTVQRTLRNKALDASFASCADTQKQIITSKNRWQDNGA